MSTTSSLRKRRFDDPGRRLDAVGEGALLADLRRGTGPARPGSGTVVLGSGDDAAVWCPAPGTEVVLSQDAVVEGEDFRRDWITPWQLGRRCLAVALSDLAGCGATPSWCLVTVCAGAATRVDDLLAMQAGLAEAATGWNCPVLGGDLSRIDGPLVIDISVGGAVPTGTALRRDRGRPGDLLVVTGSLGRAAAGLRLLLGDVSPADHGWRDAQLTPVPRLAEGTALRELGVRCAGDLSDGLLVDAARTAEASGCAGELWLDHLPVEEALTARFPQEWPELALGGGEDFELLVALPPNQLAAVQMAWEEGLAGLSVVGRLLPGSGVLLRSGEGGVAMPSPAVHSRHFT